MNILVTGSNGQLGRCIKDEVYLNHQSEQSKNNYIFLDHNTFDITDRRNVVEIIKKLKIDFVINCAAYTNVEAAEDNEELAYKINSVGVDNLAYACYINKAYMIHISTDFVFDGSKGVQTLHNEEDEPNPLNVYGKSKYDGEISALCYPNTIIIRTSWLYSEYGKNFYTTIKSRIIGTQKTSVVSDQYGTPTNAHDLANAIYYIVENKKYEGKNGIYHFSNGGIATWYEFAREIEYIIYKNHYKSDITNNLIEPCKTEEYPTKATRPKNSTLDCSKFCKDFGVNQILWITSLEKFIEERKM